MVRVTATALKVDENEISKAKWVPLEVLKEAANSLGDGIANSWGKLEWQGQLYCRQFLQGVLTFDEGRGLKCMYWNREVSIAANNGTATVLCSR